VSKCLPMQHTVLGYQGSEAPTDPIGWELVGSEEKMMEGEPRHRLCDVDGRSMTGTGTGWTSELTGTEGGKNRHKKQKNG
jgi:hypothetical protein